MKLYCSSASPYVRKIRVLAHEIAIYDQLNIEYVTLSPIAPNPLVSTQNPLGKIPVLQLDDGSQLYDSRVIAEYFDTLHDGPKMIPVAGPERWRVLRQQALADGILDAGVVVRYETFLRPIEKRWPEWIGGHCDKILAGLAALEAVAQDFSDTLDLGQMATACTVGWVDFRQPLQHHPAGAIDPSQRYPQLWQWYQKFSMRQSMVATEPH